MDLNHKTTITTTEHILSGILPTNDRKFKVLKFNSEYNSRNFINIYIINIINNFEFFAVQEQGSMNASFYQH